MTAYTLTVEVTDGRGGEASGQLTMKVTVNHSPVIESLIANEMLVTFGSRHTTRKEQILHFEEK